MAHMLFFICRAMVETLLPLIKGHANTNPEDHDSERHDGQPNTKDGSNDTAPPSAPFPPPANQGPSTVTHHGGYNFHNPPRASSPSPKGKAVSISSSGSSSNNMNRTQQHSADTAPAFGTNRTNLPLKKVLYLRFLT